MLTKNFKAVAAMLLNASTGTYSRPGLLPVRSYQGTTYYLTAATFSNSSSYPYSVTVTMTLSAASAGIQLGTGSTAATEDDITLANIITSGISGSAVVSHSLDASGNPCLAFDLTVTNTGSSSVTISEVGYMQSLNAATAQGGTSGSNRVCLLDRTVLDTPVTIPAGEYAVIRYTLKTVLGS